jgi:hypothetical protein
VCGYTLYLSQSEIGMGRWGLNLGCLGLVGLVDGRAIDQSIDRWASKGSIDRDTCVCVCVCVCQGEAGIYRQGGMRMNVVRCGRRNGAGVCVCVCVVGIHIYSARGLTMNAGPCGFRSRPCTIYT